MGLSINHVSTKGGGGGGGQDSRTFPCIVHAKMRGGGGGGQKQRKIANVINERPIYKK